MLFLGKKAEEKELRASSGIPLPDMESGWNGKFPPSSVRFSNLEVTASERKVCGNLQCVSNWVGPWRSRKRPIFETQWGCSGRCVLSLVRAAVQRESHGISDVRATHQHRVPLGLLLLEQGWITHLQLQHGLRIQKEQGGRIGEILIAECGVDAEQITRGLSLQWSRPVLDVSNFSSQSMSLVMPEIFIEQFGVLPIRVAGSRILYVGFEDAPDASIALALEKMTDLKVESGLISTEKYRVVQNSLLASKGVDLQRESFAEADAMAARITALLEQKQPIASRLTRVHNFYWLRLWLEPNTLGLHGTLPRSNDDMLDYVFTISNRAF